MCRRLPYTCLEPFWPRPSVPYGRAQEKYPLPHSAVAVGRKKILSTGAHLESLAMGPWPPARTRTHVHAGRGANAYVNCRPCGIRTMDPDPDPSPRHRTVTISNRADCTQTPITHALANTPSPYWRVSTRIGRGPDRYRQRPISAWEGTWEETKSAHACPAGDVAMGRGCRAARLAPAAPAGWAHHSPNARLC